MEITSVQNTKVKQWAKLHTKKGRDEEGRFLIEGEHLIQEALQTGCVETILIQDGYHTTLDVCADYVCHEQVMKKLSKNPSGCQMMAVCTFPKLEIKQSQRLVLLDGIQDPGNMGTIIRTALAFGYDGVICSADCVDLYNEKTIRSTQGALFKIAVKKVALDQAIAKLKNEQVSIFAMALNDEALPMSSCDKPEKLAIILGNEGQGISDAILEKADQSVKIEMNQFDSLNVAVAAGIGLYYFKK
ncbi:MAG: TrmH family RNA methyltransferase [Anaerorhabdus sp.]